MAIFGDEQIPVAVAATMDIVASEPEAAGWTELQRPPDAERVDDRSTERRYLFELHSEILPDDRRVIVCVPDEYVRDGERRFPVFYLHDGQNLVDGRTSYVAGETWRAHTTADALTRDGSIEPVVLVGIYNTGLRRMAEYTPTRDVKLGGGEGDRYGRLLVEEVKRFIDGRFRTLPDRGNTALGGSSLGGLISLYLGLRYREVFGKLAVLSPSIWWDRRAILTLVREAAPLPETQIWLDMGTAEGARHLGDADLLYTLLVKRGWRDGLDLTYLRAEGAVHDEHAWAERFDQVLQFLFPARRASPIAQTAEFRDT